MRSSLRYSLAILTLLGSTTIVAVAQDQQPPAAAADTSNAAGPREATPQTMPSKFSAENAAKDKIPLAVQPFNLTAAQRQAILQSIGSSGAPAAPTGSASGQQLEPQPGSVLAEGYEMLDLPPDVLAQAPGLRGYKFVTARDRTFIVSPPNRIVVAEIKK